MDEKNIQNTEKKPIENTEQKPIENTENTEQVVQVENDARKEYLDESARMNSRITALEDALISFSKGNIAKEKDKDNDDDFIL